MSSELQFRCGDGSDHAAAADVIDLALDRHAVELVDRQRDKQLDAVFERDIGVAESAPLLRFRDLHGRGIGHAPMSGYRIAGPHRGTVRRPPGRTVKTKSITGALARANSFQLLLRSLSVRR